jgi:outer membrane protein assembly factor BamE
MRTKIVLLVLVLLSPVLFSCSTYRMDIRQGNFVSPDMRDKLKIGMTKAQVRYVLGTPLIMDPFHDNRWDYEYRLLRDRKLTEKQGLTLFFEGDNLARMVDGIPSADKVPATDQQGKG